WAWIRSNAEIDNLLERITEHDFSTAARSAQMLMLKAKDDPKLVKKFLLKIADADGEPQLTTRRLAMGALQSVWDDDVRRFFYKPLTDADASVRRLAAEGLALACKPGDTETANELVQVLYEPDAAVKRAIILAIGRIGAPGAEDVLVNVFRADQGKDIYL